MRILDRGLWAILLIASARMAGWTEEGVISVPRLSQPPVIDGDLSEWKARAFTDGEWTMDRLQQTPWYDPERNRLTIHENESPLDEDLRATYYVAWDQEYLYLGAEGHDNVNDVVDPAHEDKRWYYKDCVCWFIEAPRDQKSESFGQGDHAFCFVIDATFPPYAAWWRHGSADRRYLEEPLPAAAVDFQLRMNPWGESEADFVLEARVHMAATFSQSDPNWTPPRIGDTYGLEIVHTDPDGGDYGGHFLVYGKGDDDATWGEMVLSGAFDRTSVKEAVWAIIKAECQSKKQSQEK